MSENPNNSEIPERLKDNCREAIKAMLPQVTAAVDSLNCNTLEEYHAKSSEVEELVQNLSYSFKEKLASAGIIVWPEMEQGDRERYREALSDKVKELVPYSRGEKNFLIQITFDRLFFPVLYSRTSPQSGVAPVTRKKIDAVLGVPHFKIKKTRFSDLPVGMPKPFELDHATHSVQLGAAPKPHEVAQFGSVYAMTHIGLVRDEKPLRQEDRAGITFFKDKSGREIIRISIADGMGGQENGHVAAEEAIKALAEPVSYLEAEQKTRAELRAKGENEAGACVVSADICGSILHPHRRGDARHYHFNADGDCLWMSTDESRATQMQEYDLPKEEAQLREDARGEAARVTNDLSVSQEGKPLNVLPPRILMPGDVYLVCSDGLSDTMGHVEIWDHLIRGTLLKELLNRMKKGEGKKDNVAVVIYKVPAPNDVTSPSHKKILESLNP